MCLAVVHLLFRHEFDFSLGISPAMKDRVVASFASET